MDRRDAPDFQLLLLALLAVFAVLAADNAVGSEPTNNEPFTGLCDRPTTQGGC